MNKDSKWAKAGWIVFSLFWFLVGVSYFVVGFIAATHK